MLEPAHIFHPSRQECGALTLYLPCGTFKSARLLSRTVAWQSAVEFHHSALYQCGRMSHMRPSVLFMSFLLYFFTHQLPVSCSLSRSHKSAKQNLISSNSNNIYLPVFVFLLLLLFFSYVEWPPSGQNCQNTWVSSVKKVQNFKGSTKFALFCIFTSAFKAIFSTKAKVWSPPRLLLRPQFLFRIEDPD